MGKHILLTGGNGFIGSHTTIQLVDAGYEVTIADNLSNSKLACLDRVKGLVGPAGASRIHFVQMDVTDSAALDVLFASTHFDCVIHFASFKAVGESVAKPLMYYRNNLLGLIAILEAMVAHNCPSIIFSSSATVYGDACAPPAVETYPTGQGITNPYGRTKYMIEEILKDVHLAFPSLSVVILRYFNPVGAHPSGQIGEDPTGTPGNLMPFLQQVAVGRRPQAFVFGNDYDTPDGTGVRDYIHVDDLASGHVKTIDWLLKELAGKEKGKGLLDVFNLGSGKGTSVLEMIHGVEKACGHTIAYSIAPRRAGDVATTYCDPTKAAKVLGWKTEKTLEDMCRDSWNWQQKNPKGFSEA